MAKKTFKKKASAKRARKKGQSVYKVKGGYRISKKKRRRRRGSIRSAMLFVIVLASLAAFLTIPGCTEPQRVTVDRFAADVKTAADTGVEVIGSEAGAAIPEPWRAVALLSLGGLGSLAAGWQTYRASKFKTGLVEVVNGGDTFLSTTDGTPATNDFKQAQNANQSAATKRLVSTIRKTGG